MQRRTFLAAMPLVAAAALAQPGSHTRGTVSTPKLHFRADGRFKILAITDLHFGPEVDPFAVALIEEMIAKEQPDLVIANGDNLMGGDSKTIAEVENSVGQVAQAMEKMAVPWAVTLGNHDREHFAHTGLSDEAFFALFERQPHNINRGWARGTTGVGNTNLLIWQADGSKPLANLWLLDSGRGVADKSLRYEWVKNEQIAWYMRRSAELEKQYGKLPALMFFHIPVREFIDLAESKKIIGSRGEDEAPSAVNSGLFAAALERGDVMGMFCGHDHQNNYIGRQRGIALGFIGVTGVLNAYPHIPENDPANARLRGGRVFELSAGQPGRFKTWVRLRDGSVNWENWNDALV